MFLLITELSKKLTFQSIVLGFVGDTFLWSFEKTLNAHFFTNKNYDILNDKCKASKNSIRNCWNKWNVNQSRVPSSFMILEQKVLKRCETGGEWVDMIKFQLRWSPAMTDWCQRIRRQKRSLAVGRVAGEKNTNYRDFRLALSPDFDTRDCLILRWFQRPEKRIKMFFMELG